jgi:hypothetical protein
VSSGLPVGLDVELRQRRAAASSDFMRLAKRRFSLQEVAQLEGVRVFSLGHHVCSCSFWRIQLPHVLSHKCS